MESGKGVEFGIGNRSRVYVPAPFGGFSRGVRLPFFLPTWVFLLDVFSLVSLSLFRFGFYAFGQRR